MEAKKNIKLQVLTRREKEKKKKAINKALSAGPSFITSNSNFFCFEFVLVKKKPNTFSVNSCLSIKREVAITLQL